MPGLALKFSILFKSFLLSHVRKIQCYLTPFNFSKRFKNRQGCMQNEKAAFILASASAFHESTIFQNVNSRQLSEPTSNLLHFFFN